MEDSANLGSRYASATDTILLTVPAGPRGIGVVSLVLGGLGSRLDLPVDRIDELTLAAATAAASALDSQVGFEIDVLDDRMAVRVGPLEDGASASPGRQRILDELVDDVVLLDRGGEEWIELGLRRGAVG